MATVPVAAAVPVPVTGTSTSWVPVASVNVKLYVPETAPALGGLNVTGTLST